MYPRLTLNRTRHPPPPVLVKFASALTKSFANVSSMPLVATAVLNSSSASDSTFCFAKESSLIFSSAIATTDEALTESSTMAISSGVTSGVSSTLFDFSSSSSLSLPALPAPPTSFFASASSVACSESTSASSSFSLMPSSKALPPGWLCPALPLPLSSWNSSLCLIASSKPDFASVVLLAAASTFLTFSRLSFATKTVSASDSSTAPSMSVLSHLPRVS
mmetsp:Transcript_12423/g.46377  ORF Transcript_12423/g.46377 Transcript_12423/m.46377 type:complete len:220 (-) Transcript_12423:2648-3307(-)